jgi:maltooligosyltrehalose trehalohydrolase
MPTASSRFGAVVHAGGVLFRVWAPAQQRLALVLDDQPDRAMARDDDGFFALDVAGARAGQRYWFRVGHDLRPDPASRFQPDGPLGASQIVDLRAYPWTDEAWPGPGAANRHVIYEMHLGTFTVEGTWAAAAARLPYLADVGITTIEVMPIAEFAGRFGWGYDGVDLYAPSRLYGTPEDVCAFVNEAHRLGLAVILDVVYNHFGPVGNFIREFSLAFLGRPGEWGDAINYDGPGSKNVRAFMTENASYWIAAYHFDGLRLDATQAIHDNSPEHVVSEICRVVRAAGAPRNVFLVGESEPQDARLLKTAGVYPDGLDAIWSEDWHHAAYVALTGRRQAYFTDYEGTAAEFASMARHGFLYHGQWYSWQTNPRGGYALGVPCASFVNFLENHDQVANTGLGTRLYRDADQALWRTMTALLLLGPALPMLFQGQEFGSTKRFTYFADHEGDVGAAVQTGRLEFLTQFPGLATPAMRKLLPRPGDEMIFRGCKLSDAERSADSPAVRLHRDLLRLRREDPVLAQVGTSDVRIESAAPTAAILLIRYISQDGHRLLVLNLGTDHVSAMNDALFAPLPGTHWSVQWFSEHPDYGGGGAVPFVGPGRWLIRGHAAMLLLSAGAEGAGR